MLLSGWTQAPPVVKDDKTPIGNGGSTSTASSSVPLHAEDDEIEMFMTNPSIADVDKKRKLSEVSKATTSGVSSVADGIRKRKNPEELEDDGDVVCMLDDGGSDNGKKQKSW